MKTNFLFPNYLKKVGWFLFITPILIYLFFQLTENNMYDYLDCQVLAIYNSEGMFNKVGFFKIIDNSILDEILLISCLIGGLIVSFTKTKNEDEMTVKIRYESLSWAMYFNVFSLLFCTSFFYGDIYFSIMTFFMISSLLFFIIRFHYMIYKLNKASKDDE